METPFPVKRNDAGFANDTEAARDVRRLLLAATQRAAHAKAAATPPLCPVCRNQLTNCSDGHARTFETRLGAITLQRTRGQCKRCGKWRMPADAVLGLEDTAGYSPAVQGMAALLASKMPVEDARVVLEHLTGIQLPRATLDRESYAVRDNAPSVCAPRWINKPPPTKSNSN